MIRKIFSSRFRTKKAASTAASANEALVPVYVPSLAALLSSGEEEKGGALTEKEVYEIRDTGTVVMVKQSEAVKMNEKRGYRDIDPQNCWQEWQHRKDELLAYEKKRSRE